MVNEIFSVVLKKVGGYFLDWAFSQVLDTVIKCCICGQKDDASMGNIQSNYLYCKNCHKELLQFTNACNSTINKSTNEIGHAKFCPGDKNWEWKNEGGFFEPRKSWLVIPYHIRAKGLSGRGIVLKTELQYFNGLYIGDYSTVEHPNSSDTVYTNYGHMFSSGYFKDIDEKIINVKSTIYSQSNDVLYSDDRVIKPWK